MRTSAHARTLQMAALFFSMKAPCSPQFIQHPLVWRAAEGLHKNAIKELLREHADEAVKHYVRTVLKLRYQVIIAVCFLSFHLLNAFMLPPPCFLKADCRLLHLTSGTSLMCTCAWPQINGILPTPTAQLPTRPPARLCPVRPSAEHPAVQQPAQLHVEDVALPCGAGRRRD